MLAHHICTDRSSSKATLRAGWQSLQAAKVITLKMRRCVCNLGPEIEGGRSCGSNSTLEIARSGACAAEMGGWGRSHPETGKNCESVASGASQILECVVGGVHLHSTLSARSEREWARCGAGVEGYARGACLGTRRAAAIRLVHTAGEVARRLGSHGVYAHASRRCRPVAECEQRLHRASLFGTLADW